MLLTGDAADSKIMSSMHTSSDVHHAALESAYSSSWYTLETVSHAPRPCQHGCLSTCGAVSGVMHALDASTELLS